MKQLSCSQTELCTGNTSEPTADLADVDMLGDTQLVVFVSYSFRVQNTIPLPSCSRVSHR